MTQKQARRSVSEYPSLRIGQKSISDIVHEYNPPVVGVAALCACGAAGPQWRWLSAAQLYLPEKLRSLDLTPLRNSSTNLGSDRGQDVKRNRCELVIKWKPMIGSNSPPACAPPPRLDGDNHRCRR